MSSSKWKDTILRDEIELLYGKGLPQNKRLLGDYPVYGSNGIVDFHNAYLEKAPGIIIGRKGSVGEIKYTEENYWAIDTTYYVKTKNNNDLKFIYYFLQTFQLNKMNSHSAVPGLNRENVYHIKCKIPSVPEQLSIASILSSLDDKIELNNQMNKTLEEIAQSIFKRWFVDFEFPNEEGKPYKSSGGAMVYSEELKKEIPKGWKYGELNEIVSIVGGGTPSTKNDDYFTDRGIPWITPKDLSGYTNKFISKGNIDITEQGLENSSATLMPAGTVLFSSRAPIGYIAIAKNEVTTNQGFKSLIPQGEFSSEFLYQYLKFNTEIIEQRASGSTFKEISGGQMKQLPLVIPEHSVLKKHTSCIDHINNLIIKNEDEIAILTKLRDSLLPKLMSGEIRVPVEKAI